MHLRLPDGHRRRLPRGIVASFGKALRASEVTLVRGLRCQRVPSVVREWMAGSLREQQRAARVLAFAQEKRGSADRSRA